MQLKYLREAVAKHSKIQPKRLLMFIDGYVYNNLDSEINRLAR